MRYEHFENRAACELRKRTSKDCADPVDEEQSCDLEKRLWEKRGAGKHQRKTSGDDDSADDLEESQIVRNRNLVSSEKAFRERGFKADEFEIGLVPSEGARGGLIKVAVPYSEKPG